jgi:hypothetical protein
MAPKPPNQNKLIIITIPFVLLVSIMSYLSKIASEGYFYNGLPADYGIVEYYIYMSIFVIIFIPVGISFLMNLVEYIIFRVYNKQIK